MEICSLILQIQQNNIKVLRVKICWILRVCKSFSNIFSNQWSNHEDLRYFLHDVTNFIEILSGPAI